MKRSKCVLDVLSLPKNIRFFSNTPQKENWPYSISFSTGICSIQIHVKTLPHIVFFFPIPHGTETVDLSFEGLKTLMWGVRLNSLVN